MRVIVALNAKADLPINASRQVELLRELSSLILFCIKSNNNKHTYGWLDKTSFLKILPPRIYQEVYTFLFQDIIEKVLFLQDRPKEFIQDLMPLLKPRIASPGTEIFKYDQASHTIYFLLSGRVIMKDKCNAIFKTYVEGSYFGEVEVINKCNRMSSAQAETACQLMSLEKEDYFSLVHN